MNITLTILQRLHEVMKIVTYIQKEKKQGMKYSIVSHDTVTAKVRPELVKQGVIYWPIDFDLNQAGNRTQLNCKVRFACVDNPGDYIDVSSMGYGIDDQDKGPGKAISYAVKYALLKVLGLETGDGEDPDEDQNVVLKPSLTDPNRQKIEAFREATTLATNLDALNAARDDYKQAMLDLAADYPAFVQEAKQQWQMKFKKMQGKLVKEADDFPGDSAFTQ